MDHKQVDWITQVRDGLNSGAPGVTIRVNPPFVSTVIGRAEPYRHFPRKAKPALEAVGDYVRTEMIPRTFRQEGPGWRRLARRTRAERAAQGYGPEHPILYRSGDLFAELTQKSHPKHIEIIKTGKYARIEIGGSSEKFVRNQAGNMFYHIPPRPMIPGTGYLPLPQRDRNNIKEILERAIKEEMRHGR